MIIIITIIIYPELAHIIKLNEFRLALISHIPSWTYNVQSDYGNLLYNKNGNLLAVKSWN